MILAIDIGNTTIALGVCAGLRIVTVYRLATISSKERLTAQLGALLGRIHRHYPSLESAVICSVVPKALVTVRMVLRRKLAIPVRIIGRDVKVPIKNNYKNPRQVGQDRLVGAYAAYRLYQAPCLIIDFGTAITFDVVSRCGEYEGGIILPGLRLSAESLFQKTALLPSIDSIRAPRSLIGRDTKESILSGLLNGYGAMCCGLIDLISDTLKTSPKVIITGGHTHLMRRFIRKKIHCIDTHLVFKGMCLALGVT